MVGCIAGLPSFASLARNRITIQQRTLVDDGVGGSTKTWSDLFSAWAWIKPISTREVYLAQELQAKAKQTLIIRYQASIASTEFAATCKVLFGTRVMSIEGVQNLHEDQSTEGKVYQKLICTEGEPA
jgi:SPP1 family predicted phage head-tail adaptor